MQTQTRDDTLNQMWQWALGNAELGKVKANIAYEKFLHILLVALGLVVVQWGINAWLGYAEVNYIFFFAGGVAFMGLAFAPLFVAGAGVAGGGYAFLKDTDVSQGVLAGVKYYMRLIIGVVLGWWVVSGLLATWSFFHSPWAFWPVAAMTCLIFSLTIVFDWSTKTFRNVVYCYAVIVLLLALASTIPGFNTWKKKAERDFNPFLSSTTSSGRSSTAAVQISPTKTTVNAPRGNPGWRTGGGEWSPTVYGMVGHCVLLHSYSVNVLYQDRQGAAWSPTAGAKIYAFKLQGKDGPVSNVLIEQAPGGC